MSVRRAAVRISAIVVAIVVGLAVPVSQLRTVTFVRSCCCPDPDDCHCPDHKTDPTPQPSMRACHSSERAIVAPQLPAFSPPSVATVPAPAPVVAAVDAPISGPHPEPPPPRPAAPS